MIKCRLVLCRKVDQKGTIVTHKFLSTTALGLIIAAPIFIAAPAIAQTNPDNEAQTNPDDEIVVTGSRIARADNLGVAPVEVLTTTAISEAGYVDLNNVLLEMPSNTGITLNNQYNTGTTRSASGVNLRGLGENLSLVLINGLRVPLYSSASGTQNFVNTSGIPTEVTDRTEVLTGGASAIYGSDAVAGVVNFIMEDEFEGASIGARYEDTDGGGRSKLGLFAKYGFSTDVSNTVMTLEFKDRESLAATDRADFGLTEDTGNGGLYSSFGARVRDRNRVFVGSTTTNLSETECLGLLGDSGRWAPSSDLGGSSTLPCRFNRAENRQLYPDTEQFNFSITNRIDLSDTWQWKTFFTYYDKNTQQLFEPKGVSQTIYMDRDNPGDYAFDVDAFDSTDRFSFRRRFVENGPGQQNVDDTQLLLQNTFSGSVGKYDVDLSYNFGRGEVRRTSPQVTFRGLEQIITFDPNDPDPSVWYPLDTINESQLSQIRGTSVQDAFSELHQVQAVVSGELPIDLGAGPVGFAVVGDIVNQDFFDAKDFDTVNNGFVGFSSTSGGGENTLYAIGAEFVIPVLDNLELTAAGRYDYYDDATNVGGAFSPQIGAKFRPIDRLLLRANYSESFKAPDLQRVHAGLTRLSTSIRDNVLDTFEPNNPNTSDTFRRVTQGTTDLSEETSKSFVVGGVFDVLDNLKITADYYNIDVRDAVITIDPDRIVLDPTRDLTGRFSSCDNVREVGFITTEEVDDMGTADVSDDVSYRDLFQVCSGSVNATSRKTSGIDFTGRLALEDTGFGDFVLRTSVNHVLERSQQDFADSPNIEFTDVLYVPSWKFNTSLRWSKDQFSSTATWNRWGEAKGQNENNLENPDPDDFYDPLGAWDRVNLNFSYDADKLGKFTVGANNIFDVDPPRLDQDDTTAWPFYSRTRGYNIVGRSFYASYRKTFQ